MEALFNQYEQDKEVGHVLVIKLKENATEEQKDEIISAFKSWEAAAPEELYEVRIGKHIKPAYDVTKTKYGDKLAFEIAAYMTFRNAAAELKFLSGPVLQATMAKILPYIEPSNTVMVDFYL